MEGGSWILLAVSVVYTMLLIAALYGYFRKSPSGNAIDVELKTAVVVAARNEAENVSALLKSLSEQPHKPDEIIFCDDHSEDSTATVITDTAKLLSLSVRVVNSDGIGKKHALTRGIAMSSADIILVTDADCMVPANWIQTHVKAYTDLHIIYVAGMVDAIKSDGISAVAAIENIFLQIASTGFGKLGVPFLSNGANMSFRKSWFESSGGFHGDELASGDDVGLLMRAAAQPGSIAWLSGTSVVRTTAARTFGDQVTQRSRWLSKLVRMQGPIAWLAGSALLAVQMIVPWFIIRLVVFGETETALSLALILKSFIELLLLSLAVPFFKRPVLLLFYPLAMIVYPAIAVTSFIKALSGKTKWKGRTLRNGVHE
ncbi:MAG: hypothetical protein RL007_974 [Bacteroidota bacterium]|jgi:cellulose synthase/poly-beta-1,6-N-acetylglucosamine synthase-like glycosyltransferase